MRVTLRPRDSTIAAREAAAMPLPREDTTPPVTKTYFVMFECGPRRTAAQALPVKREYTDARVECRQIPARAADFFLLAPRDASFRRVARIRRVARDDFRLQLRPTRAP